METKELMPQVGQVWREVDPRFQRFVRVQEFGRKGDVGIRTVVFRDGRWRMPEGAVYVGRPTQWGNPHDWRDWLNDARAERWTLPTALDRERWAKEQAVEAFRADLSDGTIAVDLAPLRGRPLVCWCRAGSPRFSCHADVLLELANR